MALTDYQVTASGNRRVHHNGALVHNGRKVLMDSASNATANLLRLGWITATVTATQYDGDASYLSTYTVKAGRTVLHNGVTKSAGQTIQLDPGEPTANDLLAGGFIQ